MAHRVAKGLVGGCALLLGATVAGCGAPQYTYIANSSAQTYFKVPYGWHKIGATALTSAEDAVGVGPAPWQVAYEGGVRANGNDFLAFDVNQPFVFAQVGELDSTESQGLSYDTLRDIFLPVSSTARSNLSQAFASRGEPDPFVDFKQISDQVLTPGRDGVHGVREIFEYTDALDGITDTFDEIALTNADQTEIYFIVLHCTTACYSNDQAEINDVMSSFTIGSPS
jgi:hypothetical protein